MSSRSLVIAKPALLAGIVAVGLWLAGCGGPGSTATSPTAAPAPAGPSAGATPSVTGTKAPSVTSTDVSDAAHTASARLTPLWPFTTSAQVRAWQAAHGSRGSQPWHLDAVETALAFTRGRLGYTDVDRATSRSVSADDAHIGVGYALPGGTRTHTAAVLHLIRFGTGRDAPWVVVGTDDRQLTLDAPRYGSLVTSPLRVGGRITGVDENLRVVVLSPASEGPLAAAVGLPAGGNRTPWSTTVRFHAPHGTVLTIAASTGGHLKRVELFAITTARVA
jgi:hypothetical protein